jgi:hypothetical protein
MRLLADYLLDADFCLPENDPPLVVRGPFDTYTLTLSNTDAAHHASTGVLAARLVFDANDLHTARPIADDYIGFCLNALTYITGHAFGYNSLKQIVDWSPGKTMRELIRYVETPMRDLAEPALGTEFGPTMEHFLVTQAGEKQQTALRWFRLGLQADKVEDQFTYFWFALEIAAEALKDREKVPSACPHCRGPLYCEACEKHPLHKKYPGQAIKALVDRYADSENPDIFHCLQKIRNTLMHRNRIASVIDSLPCNETDAVNALAHITQEALGEMFTVKNENPPSRLVMARSSDVTRKKIVMSVHASVGMGGDPDKPTFSDLPNIEVTIVHPERRDEPAS